MKGKLFTIRWVVVLILIGILAGAGAGKALPTLLDKDSPSLVSAAELSIKPAAPLAPLTPTGSGFTYQGSLKSGGNPATGNYDFAFHLFDDPTSGSQVGTPITLTNQIVTAGLFTVSLDFGSSAFNGDARYMEIAVRQSGGGGYTTLAPRQPITPTPYALYALKTAPYKYVVVVAKAGGQYTSISAALSSIIDNSSTNRYLVYVAPGVYTETVTMKQWVDIEGAGEDNTTISQVGSASGNTGTVVGASNAELRSLTVRNTGGNNYAYAIYNVGVGTSMSLLHVTATASGADFSVGVLNDASSSPSMNNVTAIGSGGTGTYTYGMANYSSSPNMNNVTVIGSGGSYNAGVLNSGSSPTMNNVTAKAIGGIESYGIYNYGSVLLIEGSVVIASSATNNYGLYNGAPSGSYTVEVNNSSITGSTNTIYNAAPFTTKVGSSRLEGGAVFPNGGVVSCAASFDGNNKRLGSLCTPDTKVVYVANTGGDFTSIQSALNSITDNSATNRYLVYVAPGTYTETVQMKQWVDIEGAGEKATRITFTGSALDNTGTVVGASNAELRSLTVANTGANNYALAIYNSGASPSLLHVTATASGSGSCNCGVVNYASSSPNMTNVTATASGSFNDIGVLNNASSPNMTDVTATVSGGSAANYAVDNYNGSSPSMTNVIATAVGATSTGVLNESSSPRIVGSIITASGGANDGLYNYNSSVVTVDSSKIVVPLTGTTIYNGGATTTRVGASQLSGGPVSNAGTLTCSATYDENYVSPGLNVCP